MRERAGTCQVSEPSRHPASPAASYQTHCASASARGEAVEPKSAPISGTAVVQPPAHRLVVLRQNVARLAREHLEIHRQDAEPGWR